MMTEITIGRVCCAEERHTGVIIKGGGRTRGNS